MNRLKFTISSAAVMIAAACAQTSGDDPAILGAWNVAEIDGAAVPDGAAVNATFSADGTVGGTSGCNRYGGDYRYGKGLITIGQTVMTEMACVDDGRMELEARFHNRFSGALSVTASPDGALVLSDEEGGLVLRKPAS